MWLKGILLKIPPPSFRFLLVSKVTRIYSRRRLQLTTDATRTAALVDGSGTPNGILTPTLCRRRLRQLPPSPSPVVLLLPFHLFGRDVLSNGVGNGPVALRGFVGPAPLKATLSGRYGNYFDILPPVL